jgi:hypothetical protein
MDHEETDCLWNVIDQNEMARYVQSDGVEMEGWFLRGLKYMFVKPIENLKVNLKQTRSGLYFNIYGGKKQIGHSSFHYDEGRKHGSMSHIVNNKTRKRRDVTISSIGDNTIIMRLKNTTNDVYEFFSSVTSSLTYSFNKLVNKHDNIINNND